MTSDLFSTGKSCLSLSGFNRPLLSAKSGHLWMVGAFWLICVSGCWRASDRPELGQVSGQVTLDGKPMANAMIFFDPTSKGRSSTATTDKSGRYELEYTIDAKGAKVDAHRVRITTFRPPDPDSKFPGVPEKIPEKYRKDGALTKDVRAGQNTLDFALVSD